MRYASLVIVAMLALTGCRKEDAAVMAKLDAPLRQKCEGLSKSGRQETLSVLGKCASAIDDAMKQAIAETGALVLSANDDIFTARVPSERVEALARLRFVTQLQLSQMSYPSTP